MRHAFRLADRGPLLLAVALAAGAAPSQGAQELPRAPASRHPVLLVHGIAGRVDNPVLPYWHRIEEALRAAGNRVYTADLDAFAPIEENAALLAARVREVLALEPGARKVNVVAHSKGGLEARYAISVLGESARVASLSTISTPHRGSALAERFLALLVEPLPASAALVDALARTWGDRSPGSARAAAQLTRGAMADFNRRVRDAEGVLYRSWACRMTKDYPNQPFPLLAAALEAEEGPNDGVVSVASAAWGEYMGLVGDEGTDDLAHHDVMGYHYLAGNPAFDPAAFYVRLVAGLAERGL